MQMWQDNADQCVTCILKWALGVALYLSSSFFKSELYWKWQKTYKIWKRTTKNTEENNVAKDGPTELIQQQLQESGKTDPISHDLWKILVSTIPVKRFATLKWSKFTYLKVHFKSNKKANGASKQISNKANENL